MTQRTTSGIALAAHVAVHKKVLPPYPHPMRGTQPAGPEQFPGFKLWLTQ
jgi:hypothetical protein